MHFAPDVTLAWLRDLGATELTSAELLVQTQEDLPALDTHDTGSRPDIAIRLSDGNRSEIIFIESKVGSKEGDRQISRYIEHLKRRIERSKALIYITREYEPKEQVGDVGVRFVQTRWSRFYRFFKNSPHKDGDISSELLRFMEEHGMAQSNRFTAVDLLAITNFPHAQKLMDATMWESVAKKFEKICGKISYKESAFTQLRNFRRYTMFTSFSQGQFDVVLGYWFDELQPTDSPWAGVTFHVGPKAAQRSEIISAIREFSASKQGAWETADLSNEREWATMFRGKELQEFLCGDDHVNTITRFFEGVLDDVAAFKSSYPCLPWKAEQEQRTA